MIWRVAMLIVAGAQPALAQSTPPDLQPKLTGGPFAGHTVEQKEKPRLQEPPRPPVAPDSAMSPPPASATPAR